MNLHIDKPACYTTCELEDRNPAFRDSARWCYATIKEAEQLTPGCKGCLRFRQEREQGNP